MKITYDDHGRFSEVLFDENDDPKTFWESWSKTIIEATRINQQEMTERIKSTNEETTKQLQSGFVGFMPVMPGMLPTVPMM